MCVLPGCRAKRKRIGLTGCRPSVKFECSQWFRAMLNKTLIKRVAIDTGYQSGKSQWLKLSFKDVADLASTSRIHLVSSESGRETKGAFRLQGRTGMVGAMNIKCEAKTKGRHALRSCGPPAALVAV